jgi:glycerol-3-phosphate acyltransferase PlsY
MTLVVPVLLLVGAYVLGSFPTGFLLARAQGVDLRKVGSGNIGATNVGRALGRRWGVVVLIVDAAKGFLPVWLAGRLYPDPSRWMLAAVGGAAILGHSFSLFMRLRGGKSVATSLGGALALAPLPALGSFLLYAVLLAALRISSIGSICGVLAFPLLVWILGPRDPAHYAFGLFAAALVIIRHADNLKRLARGEELRA